MRSSGCDRARVHLQARHSEYGDAVAGSVPRYAGCRRIRSRRQDVLWIGSHFQQGGGAGIEQERKQDFLVLPNQRHQCVWNAKDDMIVDHRQQLLLPAAKPLLSCIGLALWAVAVTTRVETEMSGNRSDRIWSRWPPRAAVRQRTMALRTLICGQVNDSPIPLSELRSCRANDVGHLKGWPRHDG